MICRILFVAAGHRIDLAVARFGGQVPGILRQHAFTAARRAGYILGAAFRRRISGVFRRVSGDGGELLHQQIGVDALELRGNGLQQMAQTVGFQDAEQQVAAADARRAEFQ